MHMTDVFIQLGMNRHRLVNIVKIICTRIKKVYSIFFLYIHESI